MAKKRNLRAELIRSKLADIEESVSLVEKIAWPILAF